MAVICRRSALGLLGDLQSRPRSPPVRLAMASAWASQVRLLLLQFALLAARRPADRPRPGPRPWPPAPGGPSRSAPGPGRRTRPPALMPSSRQLELAHLVGVGHAAALEHVQQAVALVAALDACGAAARCPSARRCPPRSAPGRSPPPVRLVKTLVMPWLFRKSITPDQHRLDLVGVADAGQVGDRVDHDARGLEILDQLVHGRQVHLQAVERAGAANGTRSRPFLTHWLRSIPMERMLRMIWSGDSSKEKYMHRLPARQRLSAKAAARLRLARAGRAGDQDAAAAVVALAAQHRVQPRRCRWRPARSLTG